MAFLDKTGLERFWAHVISQLSRKVEKVDGKGLSTNDFTNEEKEKLANLSTEGLASEEYVDNAVSVGVANLVNSAPETLDTLGEIATAMQENKDVIDALNSAIGNKVDKVEGMGLSTNDYTTEEKEKLVGIAEGATKILVDNALSSESSNPVENKVVTEAINNLNNPKGSIMFVDQVNGYTYFACMRDGNFVTYCSASSIEVTTMPIKTEYIVGEYFDPTGMIVTAIANDNTTREITGYTCFSDCLTEDITSIEITYIEADAIFTTSIPITVVFDATVVLADFEYTDNGDGTYTITDWNGTYNGEASTEMIIPNSARIII